jgi:hypothetical protein
MSSVSEKQESGTKLHKRLLLSEVSANKVKAVIIQLP